MPAIESGADSFTTLDDISESAAQLHIFFNQALTRCDLYNASYTLQFNFQNSQQDLRVKHRTFLHGVSTNPSSLDFGADYIPRSSQLFSSTTAYAQIMQAFSNLLVGSVQLSPAMPDGPGGTFITRTTVLSTAISQTTPLTNTTLAAVIESLFQNITLGLLSSPAYTTNASASPVVPVSVIRQMNTYSYNPHDLFLAYGLAIFAALIAVACGSVAVWRSGRSYGSDLSTVLRETRDRRLDRVFRVEDEGSSGADPLSKEVGEVIGVCDGGAWGGEAVGFKPWEGEGVRLSGRESGVEVVRRKPVAGPREGLE
jgi:hypothetical protein